MKERLPEILISGVALLLAGTHMLDANDKFRMDSTTLVLVVIAAVPWLFPFLKSMTLPGGTIIEFRDKLKEVQQALEVIEHGGLLPGRPEPATAKRTRHKPAGRRLATENDGGWDADPNKGKFGGKPEADGRVLEATIEPAAGRTSAACEVKLTVRSTNPKDPLEDHITFHLHPTFGNWKQYDVEAKGGVATDEITSWGAFTVGAVAGKTKLELDLAAVRGGTPKFYEQ